MASDIWTIASNGVTKTADEWGIQRLRTRTEVGVRAGELSFIMPGANVDSAPVFPESSALQLFRGGVCWFAGLVTRIPRRGAPLDESLSYVVSDPWWYLEETTFQQQWLTFGSGAVGDVALVSTTRSRVIVGQALDGTFIDLGQIMREVLYYTLYAAQGVAYPATVTGGVPPAPVGTPTNPLPFQVGRLTPTVTIPPFEVKDMKCAEIMQRLLRYVPDVVKWFDFTTSPPTLNIDARDNLPAKTISLLNNPPQGALVSGWSPTARYDLQVPAVICKYEKHVSIGEVDYDLLEVDQYPTGAADNAPKNFVQTVDLLPGRAVYQHQDVTVIDRPRTEADEVATAWVTNNPLLYWLFGDVTNPSYYDAAGITVQSIDTELDPHDPNNTTPQPGFALNALTEQLVAGAITSWMISQQGVLAAKVKMAIVLAYSGSDAATQALFNANPSAPPNTLLLTIGIVATNASTGTYKQLTSTTPGETSPTGYAQLLYTALSQLHQQGALELTEDECSGRLPCGCIFNSLDGAPEWLAMNALVLSVAEDIDRGVTTVECGPTMMLGLADLLEMRRANTYRVNPASLEQRTSALLGEDNAVIGHAYSPEATLTMAPGGGSAANNAPWAGTIKNVGTPTAPIYQLFINAKSYLMKSQTQGDTVAVSGLNTGLSFNPAGDFYYLECTVASLAAGTATVNTGSAGGTFDPSKLAWDSGGKAYLANDGAAPPNQTFFRVLLGLINAPATAGGAPTVTPCCINNLLLFNENEAGFACLNAYPTSTGSA